VKWLLNIVGIVLALLGILWILQGTDIITSGFMAGHIQYTFLGIVSAILGIALLLFNNRRQKGTPTTSG